MHHPYTPATCFWAAWRRAWEQDCPILRLMVVIVKSIYALVLLAVPGIGLAQTHSVKAAEPVVRAVGVFEWTGDLLKPDASRLVPVSLSINRHLEDAGVYLARPIPFALDTGNVFELEKGGVSEGTLELSYARHVETTDAPRIDDGWFGYGAFRPKAPESAVNTRKSGPLPTVVASGGKGPHFSKGPAASDAEAKTDSPAASAKVDRSSASGAGRTVSTIDDPEVRKRDADSDSARDDPERPTLKKRTPAETRSAEKKANQASVSGGGSLNDDPDRPNLHRGSPSAKGDRAAMRPLAGVPSGMHQMVAVSDARNRPEHEFTRSWESDVERTAVLGALRKLALEQLNLYNRENPLPGGNPHPMLPGRAAPRAARLGRPTVPVPITDAKSESLTAYTLSYGGAATYVYSAATIGLATRYITLVAQREPDGSVHSAWSSVTDATHLDRTPQFRLVDAVDADASNRASLLFELRAQTSRQFALYRVLGGHAEQVFTTGFSD